MVSLLLVYLVLVVSSSEFRLQWGPNDDAHVLLTFLCTRVVVHSAKMLSVESYLSQIRLAGVHTPLLTRR